jgi:hypothetical protein
MTKDLKIEQCAPADVGGSCANFCQDVIGRRGLASWEKKLRFVEG